jgi:hypothetical protein
MTNPGLCEDALTTLSKNKAAIVYGAAGSIGATTAHIFAREGAALYGAPIFVLGTHISKQEAWES